MNKSKKYHQLHAMMMAYTSAKIVFTFAASM